MPPKQNGIAQIKFSQCPFCPPKADMFSASVHGRFGSEADICDAITHVRFNSDSDWKSRHPSGLGSQQEVQGLVQPSYQMLARSRSRDSTGLRPHSPKFGNISNSERRFSAYG